MHPPLNASLPEAEPDLVPALEAALERERAAREAAEERIAIILEAADPGSQEAIDKADSREKLILVLKSQMDVWMRKHAEARCDANYWK